MSGRGEQRWLWPETVEEQVGALVKGGIHPVLARILVSRGFTDLAAAQAFLEPGRCFEDPWALSGMAAAVRRVEAALAAGERIRVYGDYDVDGLASTALLAEYLAGRGGRVDFRLPSRFEEGYGLSRQAVEEAAADGIRLLITVDCGVTAVAEVARAAELGLDVIITDHHEPPAVLPRAVAVLNPKQPGCPYPFKELAGVGVAFKLVQALAGVGCNEAREALANHLDLVALGTVADVVPLVGENRLYARWGLDRLRQAPRPGLAALLQVGGLDRKSDSAVISFGLAPRLNAAGRLGDPTIGVELLLERDPARAESLAGQLEAANRARQALEEQILVEVLASLAEQGDPTGAPVLVAAGEGWHPGVIGIVAQRVVELFHRPAVVISLEGGVGHGSARSIAAFHLYEALSDCADLFLKFGGHAMAAGLTLPAENVPLLRVRLAQAAEARLTPEDLQPTLRIDACVGEADLTPALVEEVLRLAPFGAGNPSPVLALRGVEIAEERLVGEGRHLKLAVRPAGGTEVFDCIGWRKAACQERLRCHFGPVDLAFSPALDEWRGARRLRLVLQDVKPSPGEPTPIDQLFAAAEAPADPYATILESAGFHTKVVGVSFEGRQEVLAGLRPGQPLRLVREPENPHDPSAVRVETEEGVILGYLRAGLARHLGPAMDQGVRYTAAVTAVTGGEDGQHRGVNIFLDREPGEEELAARAEAGTRRDSLVRAGEEAVWTAIRQALLEDFAFRDKQSEALARLQEGRNTLVVMGTGRGKSAIFQAFGAFQALCQGRITLILYPLRALVNDQLEAVRRRLSALGLRAYQATGSLSTREREELAMALALGEADFLLATPEYAELHLARQPEVLERLGFLVVDEAHHLARPNSNRAAYRRLGRLREALGGPLTLAVTATADTATASRIVAELSLSAVVVDRTVRTNLRIRDARQTSDADKALYLAKLFRRGEKAVAYVNSRDQAVEVARRLRKAHLAEKDAIAFYHGGLTPSQRAMLEDLFREGAVRLMVATSAFGEGVDVPDIRHVVHYHLPFNETDFNQQSGRAGRDGEEAWIHLLYNDRDVELNRLILKAKAPDREALRQVYLALEQVAAAGEIDLANADLAELANVTPDTVSTSLGILVELGLLDRVRDGAERRLYLREKPEKKLDLTNSIRYNEGMHERAAFEAFQVVARTAPAQDLLAMVNRPIVPEWPDEERQA
ncbi:MAG: single-stranded-DNA-specific exonuclease RecJ [Bacillota bacterium]|nr:single-stranded-DNA-specific exonuclease RecJ [Bacillota bacterium]